MTNQWKHPALQAGGGAVITGAASGIGLAAAGCFVRAGLNVVVADRDEQQLQSALQTLQAVAAEADGAGAAGSFVCDVSDMSQMTALADFAADTLGAVNVLMNNAGTAMPTGPSWDRLEAWKTLIEVNLWGVIHGVQAFVPAMLAGGRPGLIINTGSKQGLTRPPGNSAYNLSKAGVIAFTESLAYELRQQDDCRLAAHLLLPGFTYTGMIARFLPEKPDAAWTSEQVADFMLTSLERGDFYILCPDNDVTRQMDEKRAQWQADDLIQNRPALSRWHPDFAQAFAQFMQKD